MTFPGAGGAAGKARLYERSTPALVRSERGVFYTPEAVADVVAAGALALFRARARPGVAPTVLDPSCGAGALLAAAARAAGGLPVRLVGRDIDPAALALARERLGPDADLAFGDALAPGPTADVVLTNPPYGRDRASLDRDRFVTFWRAALDRVAPGGVLAVLAPRSWITGVRYAAARRDVMSRSGVHRVVDLPAGSFPDAYVDTCVTYGVPGSRPAGDPVASEEPAPHPATLGSLFLSRRGILAPPARRAGTPLLVGRAVPFVWPRDPRAFTRIFPGDVVEGKAALALDRGPRLLVRRIVGRARRLTCIVTDRRALVKKDFYVLVPRRPRLSLPAYAALLHARSITLRLAASEAASTREDFAQVTLARLRELRVPPLDEPTLADGKRVARLCDLDVDARDPRAAAAWLATWAAGAAVVGRALSRRRVRHVDADPSWSALRERLDAFVARML